MPNARNYCILTEVYTDSTIIKRRQIDSPFLRIYRDLTVWMVHTWSMDGVWIVYGESMERVYLLHSILIQEFYIDVQEEDKWMWNMNIYSPYYNNKEGEVYLTPALHSINNQGEVYFL